MSRFQVLSDAQWSLIEGMDATARVKAMAHELAHITLGHEDRRREGLHRGIGKAESVAMMVTAAWGMDSTGYTVPYVGGWSASVKDRDPVEVVRETGELVRRTAVAILDRLPDPPLGDGSPPGLDRTHGTEPAPVHPRAPEVARIEHAIRAREPVRL